MSKSKRTKATAIQPGVKQKVWERQHGRSLIAPYKRISVDMCCCHYIPRSAGGKGIEENIFGLYQSPWDNEHRDYDEYRKVNNLENKEARLVVRNHLASHYKDWDEKKLKYRKGEEYD